jgi:malonyl CoA-acyl carrier protein transacylase
MPLTYKQAKERLFGENHVVIPGTPDHLKIRQLMAQSAEPKKQAAPFVLNPDGPLVNPINVPAKPAPRKLVESKTQVFASPEFQKHYITFLDRIAVGNARNRNAEKQKENSTTSIETNGEATAQ